MNKDKISFVVGGLNPGGAERVITTLSNQLLEKYEVHIILLTKTKPFYTLHPNIKLFHCREQFLPSKNLFQALKNNYSLYKTISFYLRKETVNLVIGFTTTSNILALLAARRNGVPCIISERNYPKKSSTQILWRNLRKYLYKKAAFLVVQTSEIKAEFESIVEKDKIIILNNPISLELSKARDINFEKENIILNVGSLTPQKGQDLLIKAFANINNDNWKLFIIGKGEKQKQYEELINVLNLKDKVKLLGTKQDIAYYYNLSKIFAFTSNFEGFPNALTEAMHFGLPCVSTDCPTGPAKLITNNHNGYLIQIGDQNQLENYLTELIQNEKLRKKFSQNALKSVELYKVESVCLEWISLFEKLLNQKK